MPPIAVLVALADPTRCRIIEILHASPQPVHVLAAEFEISRPAISRHLRVLKQAGLISEKKIGRENRYALHPKKLKSVGDWIEAMRLARPAEKAPEKASSNTRLETKPAVAPKAPSPKPISQMGFDF